MLLDNYHADFKRLSAAVANRHALGERELLTLETLAPLVGYRRPAAGGVFLDLGCGDQHLRPAVEGRGLEYRGLDITDLNLATDRLPLPDGTVDIAIGLAIIEHIANPETFLSEIHRVLKPGGLIYLSTPNWQMDSRSFYDDPTHVKPYTPDSLETVLRLFGFRNAHTFPGLRCKPLWFYQGRYRFAKAYYLFPFSGNRGLIPSFLKGRARSIFALALK
jgi:SAM-dependent methyltransferase